MSEWSPTNNLRFDQRMYQAARGYFGGGTETKHKFVLQQEWQHETGRTQWRDVPTVSATSTQE